MGSLAASAASAAAGAGFELLFGNFLKLVIDVSQKSVMFSSTLKSLADTLTRLESHIKKMDSFNVDFDRPYELDGLKNLIRKGEKLVNKCVKVKKFDIIRRPHYYNKLVKLNREIERYIATTLQVQQSSDIKETLLGVKVLSSKVNTLSIRTPSNNGYSSGLWSSKSNLSCGTPSSNGYGSSLWSSKSNLSSGTFSSNSYGSGVWSSNGGSGGDSSFTDGVCSARRLKIDPIGMEIPLKDLKEKLLTDTEGCKVVVVSAAGGCGKTTLALKLCHDDKIKGKYRNNIFFVTVSKSPILRVIIQRLFQHLNSMETDFLSDEDAFNQLEILFGTLASHPILLVLDDIWSGAESLVERFMFPIKNYKILVTSRFKMPRFGSSYKLQTLNDQDAMTLFCHEAFLPEGNIYRPDQDIVNKIVEVCKGFPLALSVVGRSLRGKSAAEWSTRIKECTKATSILAESEVHICLQSSVDALKDNAAAKECYKDLGSFPEDQKIPASTLVDMWAELHKLDEDGAIANVHELSARNLIDLLITRKDASEDYSSINVRQHDLLRELAIRQSDSLSIENRKRLFIEISGNKFPEWWEQGKMLTIKARLLSICSDKFFSSGWCNMKAPEVEVLVLNFQTKNYALPFFMSGMDKLKVLVVANYGFSPAKLGNDMLIGSLSNLKRIRLEKISIPSSLMTSLQQLENLEKISLVMCNISQAFSRMNSAIQIPSLVEIVIDYCVDLVELPEGLCDLINLRKLSITNCHKLSALPEEIGNLANLEVLMLNSCIELEELPESIGELRNLSILDISACMSIMKLPESIGQLTNLRKLYMVECSICDLPYSVRYLSCLKEVIGDEETANSWKDYSGFLPNLNIKVHKDVNLDWLH